MFFSAMNVTKADLRRDPELGRKLFTELIKEGALGSDGNMRGPPPPIPPRCRRKRPVETEKIESLDCEMQSKQISDEEKSVDPSYSKFIRMHEKGVPDQVIRAMMTKQGLDHQIVFGDLKTGQNDRVLLILL